MKKLATTFAAFMTAAAFADGASGSLTVGCPTANIDEFRAVATFAKSIGATHVDASQVEYSLWQWDVNRYDPYPNWSMHRPSDDSDDVRQAVEQALKRNATYSDFLEPVDWLNTVCPSEWLLNGEKITVDWYEDTPIDLSVIG